MRKEDLNKEQLIGALGASENLCDSLKKENDELRKRLEKLEIGICGESPCIVSEFHSFEDESWIRASTYDDVLLRLKNANERISKLNAEHFSKTIEQAQEVDKIRKENKELESENKALKQRIKDLGDVGNNYEPQFAPDDDISAFNYECVKRWTTEMNCKRRIQELQDQHQQDCIKINQLHVTIDILTEKYSRLRNTVGMD